MCEPVTIGLAIGVMSAASAQRQAKAQHEAQAAAFEANVKNSEAAKITADRQANLNLAQEEEKDAEVKINNALQLRKSISRTEVAIGETGGNLNNNAIVQDMRRQGLMSENMASANMGRRLAQFNEGGLTSAANYQSRINSVAMPEWDSSSVATTSFLQGASSGLAAGSAASMMGIGSGGGSTVAASTTTGSQSATRNVFTGNTPQMSKNPQFKF